MKSILLSGFSRDEQLLNSSNTATAFHKCSKHFELDYRYVRERVGPGALVVRHVPACQQLADIFTKSLPYILFDDLRFKLGVSLVPTPNLRGTIRENEQNDAVSKVDIKGKSKMGLDDENKPSSTKSEESPAKMKPAQRLSSKGDSFSKSKGHMTLPCRDVNGVKLYNRFSILDGEAS